MTEPIDPTDPPSQSEPDAERVENLDHEIEGAREQVARHDRSEAEPHFIDDGDKGDEYEDNAIAPP